MTPSLRNNIKTIFRCLEQGYKLQQTVLYDLQFTGKYRKTLLIEAVTMQGFASSTSYRPCVNHWLTALSESRFRGAQLRLLCGVGCEVKAHIPCLLYMHILHAVGQGGSGSSFVLPKLSIPLFDEDHLFVITRRLSCLYQLAARYRRRYT